MLLCPWDFYRQGYWSGLPVPTPGDLPDQGLNPCFLHLLHWQADSLPLHPLALETWSTFCLSGFASLGHCIQWRRTVLVFRDWCLSLSIVLARLMSWHVSVLHSFLWSNDIRWYGCIHILFVHLSVDKHLGCFSFLAITNITAVNIDVQVFVWLCFDFSWVYL